MVVIILNIGKDILFPQFPDNISLEGLVMITLQFILAQHMELQQAFPIQLIGFAIQITSNLTHYSPTIT